MKAAVFYGQGDIRVENVKDPLLEPDGIIIQVKACGICGSDLHPQDSWDRENGMILGHEFSGDVVEVGANVTATVLPRKSCLGCRSAAGVCLRTSAVSPSIWPATPAPTIPVIPS